MVPIQSTLPSFQTGHEGPPEIKNDCNNLENKLLKHLQLYRNYFILGKSSSAHHFTAYYINPMNGFPDASHLQCTSQLEVSYDQQPRAYAAVSILPPYKIEPIPDQCRAMAAAVANFVHQQLRQPKNLQIQYDGQYTLTDVEEIILRSTANGYGKFERTSLTFSNGGTEDPFNKVVFMECALSSFQSWVQRKYGSLRECPSFIPFVVSPDIQGSFLLHAPDKNPLYEAECLRFKEVALTALKAKENQTFQNYWNEIEKQPKKILPPGFAQKAVYKIKYRAQEKENAIKITYGTQQFEFILPEALKSTVTKTATIASLALMFEVSLSLKDHSLAISIKKGERTAFSYVYRIQDSLLRDGEEAAMLDDWKIEFPREDQTRHNSVNHQARQSITCSEEEPFRSINLILGEKIENTGF